MKFLFVGEKPSAKAKALGASWHTRQLAGKTLAAALDQAGIEERDRAFINLFGDDPEATVGDTTTVRSRVRTIRAKARDGFTVVALGRKVQRVLTSHHVEHLRLTHPAARGSIRKSERYHAHVRETLKPDEQRPGKAA